MPDFHMVPLRLVFLSTICTVSPYRRYANRSECTRRLMELDSYSCVHVSAKLCYKSNCTAIILGIRGDLRNWQWTEALRTQTTIFYWNCHWDVFSSRIPSWWFSNLIGIEAKKKKNLRRTQLCLVPEVGKHRSACPRWPIKFCAEYSLKSVAALQDTLVCIRNSCMP